MEKFIVIENIAFEPFWNDLLEKALELADLFSVVYPDGEYDDENPLLSGKLEVYLLPNLQSEPWSSMKHASVYSGELTEQAKAFIRKYMLQTPDKTTDNLWNFSLFKNDVELLNLQDFDVCLIGAKTDLTAYFLKKDSNRSENI